MIVFWAAPKLEAHHQRLDAAEDEEQEGGDQVEDPDLLVVGGVTHPSHPGVGWEGSARLSLRAECSPGPPARRALVLEGSPAEHPAVGECSGFDEATTDRVASELDAIAHTELLQDIRPVAVYRLLADHELLRDLLARQPLCDQLHDLELPRG